MSGTLVVLFRDDICNCRFWSYLWCSGQKDNIFTHTQQVYRLRLRCAKGISIYKTNALVHTVLPRVRPPLGQPASKLFGGLWHRGKNRGRFNKKILASFTDVIFTVHHLSKYAQKNITSWPHLKSANQHLTPHFGPFCDVDAKKKMKHKCQLFFPSFLPHSCTTGRACWQATFRSQIGSKTKTPRLIPSKIAGAKTLMSYTFSMQNLRFFKENSSETIWYIALKFSEISGNFCAPSIFRDVKFSERNEIFVLLQYSEIFFFLKFIR